MYPYVEFTGKEISTYSIMTCVGATFSVPLFTVLLRRKNLLNLYFDGMIGSMLGLLLGGKLLGIVSTFLNIYQETGAFCIGLAYRTSGIVYYGGLLGFLFWYKVYCMVKGLTFGSIADEVAVCIPLFHFWGRIGCFLSGCCYGCEYNGAFSVLYNNGHNVVRRVPTQLIEALFEICIFLLLFSLYSHKRIYGKLLTAYLYLYAVFRFFIEFVRGDENRGVYGKISFSQCISLIIIAYIILNSKGFIMLSQGNEQQ